ncbi:hypothetical protein HRbin29_01771 [bacterium HR29]|jgi:uncharacterized protein YqgV (UPF0045/DUF77 family)|nr:hypothetical protein HRbin29_01771 [bacterium HR29]
MIQATAAVYPLGDAPGAIEAAIEAVAASGVTYEVRPMQTELRGEPDAVFAAIRAAFDAAAARGGVVMTVTISNACPLP